MLIYDQSIRPRQRLRHIRLLFVLRRVYLPCPLQYSFELTHLVSDVH